ncbi:MAG: MFS transporter [Planctomycetales bacterium]|nr:MFS transporter [Planctomycetales bacterium]
MFLLYWSFGIWVVTVGTYIAANTEREGRGIFSAGFIGYSAVAGAIGSVLSPAIVGYLSDRFFSAQTLLAVMQFACAAATWGMHESQTELGFLTCLLVYFHAFFPAMAMTNKIALSQLANTDAEYPSVRIAGTLGWIAAGLCVGFVIPIMIGRSIEATRIPLTLATISSLVMGAYALTLPPTLPAWSTDADGAGPRLAAAAPALQNRPLALFLLVAVFACMASAAYNNYANVFLNREGFPYPAASMIIGQISDIACLSITPWLIARVGLRPVFAVGILAWSVRYSLLAAGSYFGSAWSVYAAIAVHGPCFVFVFVAGAMLVNQLAIDSQRGTAQGLFTVASTGIGTLLGALIMGRAQTLLLTPENVTPAPYDWPRFWLVPAFCSLAALGLTAYVFKLSIWRRR